MRLPDGMVERAAKALCLYAMGEGVWEGDYQDMWREQARAALEAALSEGGDVQVVTKRELVLETDDDGTPTKVSRVLSPLWPRKGPGRYLVIPLGIEGEET